MDPFNLPPDVEERVLDQVARARRQRQRASELVTEELARRMVTITRNNPNASPGVVTAAGVGALPEEAVPEIAAKDDGGWSLGGMIGNVTDFIGDGVQAVHEQVIKPVVRTAFTVSEGLAQELVQRPLTAALTAFTDDNATGFADAYNKYGDSALLNIAQGEVNPFAEGALGQGFFTGGTAQEQAMADRTLTIDGKMASLGRALPTTQIAGELFGEDSTAYNLAAGVGQFAADVFLDPLALASAGASSALKASKAIDATEAARAFGAVKAGGRATALIEELVPKLANDEILEALSKADAFDIVKSWKRSAANTLDADLIRELAGASTKDDVARVLLDAAQRKQVTETGFYSGLRGTRRKVRDFKVAGTAPRGMVSADDLPDAVDKIDTWLRQANVEQEFRRGITNELISIGGLDVAEQSDAFVDVVKRAVAQGSTKMDDELEAIEGFFTQFAAEKKFAREYGIDILADEIRTPFSKTNPDGTLRPTVQLIAELADDGMHLPDVTAVRRAAQRATRANKLYTSKGWENAADAGRWLTRDLFKPLAILRPAYVIRIGLEEQLRLTAMGYDSIFNHPARFIKSNIVARGMDESFSGAAGDKLRDAELMNVVQRRAYADLVGDAAPESNFLMSGNWDKYAKPEGYTREFGVHWRRELHQLEASPEARWFAQNGYDLDGFHDWARNTADGRKIIERMDRATKGRGQLLTSDENLREYGHSIAVRLASKAGGDMVKQGDEWVIRSLGDDGILSAVAGSKVKGFDLASRFDAAPNFVKFPTKARGGKREVGRLNAFVDGLFERITAKPTNTLARYPAFRQSYIKFARESMDALASDEAREQFARRMGEMFDLTKREMKDITRAVSDNAGRVGFYDDLTELDEVIKTRAAQETKDLLFDATKRSNFQDAYETAVPFFDAWAEVTTTWARLVKENPGFFIKAMQGLDSARQSGVIYANDFGEEVFAYPGGGMLSKFFPGEDSVRLEGRLQGANLVAQGVGPGFGPIVQWGVGALMPKTQGLQNLREWLAPFGTGGIEGIEDVGDIGGFVESLVPAWGKKVSNALSGGKIDPVQWNSTMGDVMKVLANSGEYKPGNPDDQQRLLNDAQRGARTILLVRALTQGVAITGASATWQIKTDGDEDEQVPTDWDPEADPDGTWHSLGVLANEYRRLREFYNYDDDIATSVFIDMYGVEPYYLSQAKTRSIAELPVDEQGDFWVRDHADAASAYPSVIGYFVPPNEDAPLDYAIYRDQITRGDRQTLTAQQQVQLANQTKARAMRSAVERRIEGLPSSAKRGVMSQVDAALEEQFPGWRNPVLGVDAKLRSSQKIDELVRAVEDERLADSPVTPTLKAYLKAREGVLKIANARGLKTLSSDRVADLREGLLQFGMQLRQQDPAFSGVWSRLLASEVRE